MKNTIKLPDGTKFQYKENVNVQLLQKVAALPYLELRKIVALGGVKFSITPRYSDLISVLDEIDESDIKRLYRQFG